VYIDTWKNEEHDNYQRILRLDLRKIISCETRIQHEPVVLQVFLHDFNIYIYLVICC
jgi:hypothetical protein